jgi:hypothetical protein
MTVWDDIGSGLASTVPAVFGAVGIPLTSCTYENPAVYTAEQLADIGIGADRTVPGTCTTVLQAEGRWCPNNGEFEPVSGGDCAFDSVNNDGRRFHCGAADNSAWGCGTATGWVGHCEIAGSQTKCKRTSYSGTPIECCKADGAAVIGGRTCDPQYRDASGLVCRDIIRDHCKTITSNPDHDPACKSFMAVSNTNDSDVRNAYCSRGNNLYNIEMCKAWVTKPTSVNGTIIDTLMRGKCTGANVNREPCKSYIRNRSTKDSSYDDVMTQFCVANPNDMLCRCIMSKHNDNTDGSLKGRPECIDPACAGEQGAATPFKTYDMNQNSDNCSYVNCQQWATFGPTIGKENMNIAEMTMNCGPSDYVDPAVKETQKVTSSTPVLGIAPTTTNNAISPEVTMVLILFLLVIGLSGLYAIFKQPSGSANNLVMTNAESQATTTYL